MQQVKQVGKGRRSRWEVKPHIDFGHVSTSKSYDRPSPDQFQSHSTEFNNAGGNPEEIEDSDQCSAERQEAKIDIEKIEVFADDEQEYLGSLTHNEANKSNHEVYEQPRLPRSDVSDSENAIEQAVEGFDRDSEAKFPFSLSMSTFDGRDEYEFDIKDSLPAQEFKRLGGFLFIAEVVGLSQRSIQRLLSVAPLRSKCSYRSLLNFVRRRSMVPKYSLQMCLDEHAAGRRSLKNASECPECSKSLMGSSSKTFWFVRPSDMISALCRAPQSFPEIAARLKRAKESLEKLRTLLPFKTTITAFSSGRCTAIMYSNGSKDTTTTFMYLSLFRQMVLRYRRREIGMRCPVGLRYP
ncbi:unnamed protein product [Agarophyton chilense]